jgi:hypothetical protein
MHVDRIVTMFLLALAPGLQARTSPAPEFDGLIEWFMVIF